jgi:hypothetical protein
MLAAGRDLTHAGCWQGLPPMLAAGRVCHPCWLLESDQCLSEVLGGNVTPGDPLPGPRGGSLGGGNLLFQDILANMRMMALGISERLISRHCLPADGRRGDTCTAGHIDPVQGLELCVLCWRRKRVYEYVLLWECRR